MSQDGLRVLFSVTFQYQLPVDWVLPVVLKYRDFANWEAGAYIRPLSGST